MKIIVAGGTGTFGTPIVTQLLAAGHDVVGIAHGTEGAQKLRRAGASVIVADAIARACCAPARVSRPTPCCTRSPR